MSSSVPMQVDSGVKSAFNDGMIRIIKVVITDDETLKVAAKDEKSGSESGDFDKMAGLVSATEPCYLLFRFNSGNGWALVTFVPDSVPVKSKMLYASTKATLKSTLGTDNFKEEIQADHSSDLSWEVRVHGKDEAKPYSAREKNIMALDLMESNARSEFSSSMAPSAARSSPSTNQHTNTRASGYHSVSIAFAAGVDAKLRELKDGPNNVVELKVSDAMDAIEFVSAFRVANAAELGKKMSDTDPRFYIYAHGSPPMLGFFLVYCCPPKSNRKLRMVYSTAKGAVNSQADGVLGRLKKALEVSEPDDVTEDCFRGAREVNRASLARPAAGAPSDNRARSFTAGNHSPGGVGAHPVYGMGGNRNSTTTKKIVIPPSYAWQ